MEDLLKPRIKVIAPMPFMKNEVGSLLYRREYKDEFSFGILTEGMEHFYGLENFKEWPYIFKILDWWEDRKPEEMPEYVKWVEKSPLNKERLLPERGMIEKAKAIKWGTSFQFEVDSQINSIQACYFLPATLSEYLNQNKK